MSIIPHTGYETTLLEKNIGDKVNLEVDMIGKYIERFLSFRENNIPRENDISKSNIDMEFLGKHGFL